MTVWITKAEPVGASSASAAAAAAESRPQGGPEDTKVSVSANPTLIQCGGNINKALSDDGERTRVRGVVRRMAPELNRLLKAALRCPEVRALYVVKALRCCYYYVPARCFVRAVARAATVLLLPPYCTTATTSNPLPLSRYQGNLYAQGGTYQTLLKALRRFACGRSATRSSAVATLNAWLEMVTMLALNKGPGGVPQLEELCAAMEAVLGDTGVKALVWGTGFEALELPRIERCAVTLCLVVWLGLDVAPAGTAEEDADLVAAVCHEGQGGGTGGRTGGAKAAAAQRRAAAAERASTLLKAEADEAAEKGKRAAAAAAAAAAGGGGGGGGGFAGGGGSAAAAAARSGGGDATAGGLAGALEDLADAPTAEITQSSCVYDRENRAALRLANGACQFAAAAVTLSSVCKRGVGELLEYLDDMFVRVCGSRALAGEVLAKLGKGSGRKPTSQAVEAARRAEKRAKKKRGRPSRK